MTPESSSLAFFLLRAWTDEGHFRARITASHGPDDPETVHFAADREEVMRCLREWLDEFGAQHHLGAPEYR
jgi:hypothetical protein